MATGYGVVGACRLQCAPVFAEWKLCNFKAKICVCACGTVFVLHCRHLELKFLFFAMSSTLLEERDLFLRLLCVVSFALCWSLCCLYVVLMYHVSEGTKTITLSWVWCPQKPNQEVWICFYSLWEVFGTTYYK